jgi:aryl-alcohol dehydrogenase-like predicted oxidoreductase
VLLLGLWNHNPPPRILAAALELQKRGLVRHIAVSTHNRPLVSEVAAEHGIAVVHLRYNAVHRGAEQEVFPHVAQDPERPGIVAFTATSWRQLLDPKRVPPGERTPTAMDCYRFVLSNPAVDVCLTGPSTEKHVEDALRAIDLGPMSEDELVWMRRVGDFIHQ